MRSVHKAILHAALHMRPQPAAILDIGCGNGAFTQALAAAFPSAFITAMDTFYSPRFVPARNTTFVKGSAEELPFAPDSFDAVIAALSLHHWKDKGAGIREAYRVLKSGGRLIIGDPLLEDWMRSRFWSGLMQALDKGNFTNAQRLNSYLDRAGFEKVSISLVPESMKSLYLITAVKG